MLELEPFIHELHQYETDILHDLHNMTLEKARAYILSFLEPGSPPKDKPARPQPDNIHTAPILFPTSNEIDLIAYGRKESLKHLPGPSDELYETIFLLLKNLHLFEHQIATLKTCLHLQIQETCLDTPSWKSEKTSIADFTWQKNSHALACLASAMVETALAYRLAVQEFQPKLLHMLVDAFYRGVLHFIDEVHLKRAEIANKNAPLLSETGGFFGLFASPSPAPAARANPKPH